MSIPIKNLLLITDMDGTLLRSDKSISPKNKQVVQDWVAAGGRFTIATGRSILSAKQRVDNLPVNCPAVLFNGCAVYDYATRQVAYEIPIDLAYREIILYVLRAYPQVGVELLTPTDIHVVVENPVVRRHLGIENLSGISCSAGVFPGHVLKVLFGVEQELMPAFIADISSRLPGAIYGVHTDVCYYELLPVGATKGSGLEHLRRQFPEVQAAVAFGDYFNDVEMLQTADFGFAVENAPEGVREKADYITTTSDDDSLYNGICMLQQKGLIETF